MIKIQIAKVAKQHGFKNAFNLQKALDCSPTVASRLWKGNFKKIGLDTIQKLCDLLDCDSSQFLIITPKKRQTAEKPINQDAPQVVEKESNNEKPKEQINLRRLYPTALTTEEVGRKLGRSSRTVIDYITSGELKVMKDPRTKRNWILPEDLEEFMARKGF